MPAVRLTPRQKAFVREYLVDLNASAAVLRAGYSETGASVTGSRLLSNPRVGKAIAKGQDRRAQRLDVTTDMVVEEFRRIAVADITDVIQVRDGQVYVTDTEKLPAAVRSAIAEIQQTANGIRVKMHSKGQALEALARHLGLFNDRVSVSVDGPAPVIQLQPIMRETVIDAEVVPKELPEGERNG